MGQTPEQQFKPIVRIFPNSYVSEKKEIDLRGKKPLFLAEQPERHRKEKGHVEGGKSTNAEMEWKGKSFGMQG